jgi:signal transduction histidine kinase
VQSHPDAAGVALQVELVDASDTLAVVDAKQIERAIYNLLLNACQAVRCSGELRQVTAGLGVTAGVITVTITDTGPGVPEGIRESLFEPFISDGKQKGTRLGLTLAHCIAQEHGGSVELVSFRVGETIFRLTISRGPAVSISEWKGTNQAVKG